MIPSGGYLAVFGGSCEFCSGTITCKSMNGELPHTTLAGETWIVILKVYEKATVSLLKVALLVDCALQVCMSLDGVFSDCGQRFPTCF